MPAIFILALLLIAGPAAAQEQTGHFKSNPNGTDAISTPSGAYEVPEGDTADASKEETSENPFSMTGPQPKQPGPDSPSPASAVQSQSFPMDNIGKSFPLDNIGKPAGPASISAQ